jgi:hypothetical protein
MVLINPAPDHDLAVPLAHGMVFALVAHIDKLALDVLEHLHLFAERVALLTSQALPPVGNVTRARRGRKNQETT